MFEDSPVSYHSVFELLQDVPELESPAMLHGFAVGVLAAGVRPTAEQWVQQIHDFSQAEDLLYWQLEPLLELFESTLHELQSDDFAFALFLPDDEENTFEVCLEAFSQWCQGFLHGFAVLQGKHSDECEEIIKDLSEISQIDSSSLENDENDAHFIELEEFVRMAVINLFLEYAPESKDKAGCQDSDHIH